MKISLILLASMLVIAGCAINPDEKTDIIVESEIDREITDSVSVVSENSEQAIEELLLDEIKDSDLEITNEELEELEGSLNFDF